MDKADGSDAEEADAVKKTVKRRMQACVLCPQRLMKNDKMVQDHLASKVSYSLPITQETVKLNKHRYPVTFPIERSL